MFKKLIYLLIINLFICLIILNHVKGDEVTCVKYLISVVT